MATLLWTPGESYTQQQSCFACSPPKRASLMLQQYLCLQSYLKRAKRPYTVKVFYLVSPSEIEGTEEGRQRWNGQSGSSRHSPEEYLWRKVLTAEKNRNDNSESFSIYLTSSSYEGERETWTSLPFPLQCHILYGGPCGNLLFTSFTMNDKPFHILYS